MTIDDLVRRDWEWLQSDNSDGDVVISTRIRLARNLAEHPFVTRLSHTERCETERQLQDVISRLSPEQPYTRFDMEKISELDRTLLMEGHLISRELAQGEGTRSVMISPDGRYSIMLMEEDHLRIQVLHSGLDLQAIWSGINQLDDQLEANLVYAWSKKLGYLTACPTNVGTGMRVSVMLHLPALVATRQFPKVYQSLQKISLDVRGMYGEGSQAFGNFYQISNHTTLGVTEEGILQQVKDVLRAVIAYERRARETLLNDNPERLRQDVMKNLQTLYSAESIGLEETMYCLSIVRLGVTLGLLPEVPMRLVNLLLLQTQPGHLQWIYGGVISSMDTNVLRAQFLQTHLGGFCEGETLADDSSSETEE